MPVMHAPLPHVPYIWAVMLTLLIALQGTGGVQDDDEGAKSEGEVDEEGRRDALAGSESEPEAPNT